MDEERLIHRLSSIRKNIDALTQSADPALVAIATDVLQELCSTVDDLRVAQEDLRRQNEGLEAARHELEDQQAEQRFLRQLIQAHERDRQLMAYEIHDGLVQVLSGALLHLESFQNEQGALTPRARQGFVLVLELIRQAVADSRRVISGLRPPILDEHGIVVAIEYLVAEHSAPPLQVRFDHEVQFDRLEPLLEGNLFRMVQEALTNAQRHSRATEVVIRLSQSDRHVHLHIHDDGVGFDPLEVPEHRFGLQGIRKRASLLGGSARIESAPGAGTRIDVDLPLLESIGSSTPLIVQPTAAVSASASN